jgi:protein CMS1
MSEASQSQSSKRKIEEHGPSTERKKRRKSKKPRDIDDEDLDESLGLNLAISRMDNQLVVDYVARRTKQFEPKLSLVELEDRYLPGML